LDKVKGGRRQGGQCSWYDGRLALASKQVFRSRQEGSIAGAGAADALDGG